MSRVRKYLNQEGSIFVLVLMMMTVLIILGMALLFASTANYAMNASYIKGNRSFYWADGWIERINNTLEEGTMYVQKISKEYAESKKQEIIERYTYTDPVTGAEYVDDESIEKALVIEYMDAFNRYTSGQSRLSGEYELEGVNFDGEYLQTVLQHIFERWSDEEPLISVSDVHISDYPDRDIIDSLDQQMIDVDKEVTITVEVTSMKEHTEKKILAQFEFLKDPQQIPMKKVLSRKINPIWMRGITTESSLVAVEGNVEINGDVYAYGNLPPDNSSEEKYGGIIAGVSSALASELEIDTSEIPGNVTGNIEINGAARTRANLHTAYGTDADASAIFVSGDTFCESVQVDSASHYSTININGNVYAYNDLKINSSNSDIHIGGSYYGFMEGGNDSYRYNMSSAIILNDISSSIHVDGEAVIGGKVYVENIYVNSYDSEGNPIKVPYKTGESVSIFKNYNAYRHQLEGEDLLDFYPPWIPFNMYWGVEIPSSGSLNNRLLTPNNDNNRRTSHFLNYFRGFASDIITGGVIIGSNDVSSPVMEVYAPAVILSDGYVIDPTNKKIYQPATGEELPEFRVPLPDGRHKEIQIKDWAYFNSHQQEWQELFNRSTWIQPDKPDDEYKNVQEEPEFEDLVNDSINEDTFYENTISVTQIDEETGIETVEHYYSFVDISGSDIKLAADRINGKKGLIFTMGDLYIDSGTDDIDFTGTIIAKGNIVFYGTGEKTVTYDEDVLKQLIYNDEHLEAFFKKGSKIVDLQAVDITLSLQAVRNVKLIEWREIP